MNSKSIDWFLYEGNTGLSCNTSSGAFRTLSNISDEVFLWKKALKPLQPGAAYLYPLKIPKGFLMFSGV